MTRDELICHIETEFKGLPTSEAWLSMKADAALGAAVRKATGIDFATNDTEWRGVSQRLRGYADMHVSLFIGDVLHAIADALEAEKEAESDKG